MFKTEPDSRAALVVAHPGHELRVFGWLSQTRPEVFVLTDGSGRSGRSRLPRTTEVLDHLRIKPGAIYGRLTDAEIYAAILSRDLKLFTELADELARALRASQINLVVTDAVEGFNPAHDICRVLTDVAVKLASKTSAHEVKQFDIVLAGKISEHSRESLSGAMWVTLDEQTWERKLETARAYCELAHEVDQILADEGVLSLKTECLRRAPGLALHEKFFANTPQYEPYGQQRADAGYYPQVIRYRTHFLPLARGLMEYAAGDGHSAHAHSDYQ